jgi:hypothetical protein
MSKFYYNDEDFFNCDIEIMGDIVQITLDYNGRPVKEYYTITEYNEMVQTNMIYTSGGCNIVNA